jgi:hypothetical protein
LAEELIGVLDQSSKHLGPLRKPWVSQRPKRASDCFVPDIVRIQMDVIQFVGEVTEDRLQESQDEEPGCG